MDVIRPLFVKEERHEKDVRVADDNNKEKLIESTRKEMGEMKEENERLKKVLTKIMKDYDSLQRQVFSITQKEEADKKSTASIHNQTTTYRDAGEEAEFVSLSLGMSSSSTKAVKRKDQFNHDKNATTDCKANQGLTLGLSSSNRSAQASECSSKGSGRDVQDIAVTNHTVLDVTKYDANDNDEDALQHHVQVKRARVSVRTRCDTPTMNDGCQWRKYGQKISKGNPCPRAYYRCTMAPACPVRKQVQRCAEDMSILTTTYEGTHNHPLPVAATTMASTTSAAATMLLSGVSSTSQPFSMATAQSTTAGLSFSSQYQGIPTNPYVTMNPSTFSTSLSHPTVTLDLTDPSSFSSVMLNQSIVPSNILSSTPLKYHPISGNTSATESTSDMQSSWRNHISRSSGYPSYFGKNQPSFETKNPYVSSSHDYQSQVTTSLQQSLLALKDKFPTKNENVAPSLSTDLLAKVLSSDLGFQAAFAATISSITKSKMDVQGSKATFPSNSIHSSPLALSASSNSSSFLTPAKSGGAIFK